MIKKIQFIGVEAVVINGERYDIKSIDAQVGEDNRIAMVIQLKRAMIKGVIPVSSLFLVFDPKGNKK